MDAIETLMNEHRLIEKTLDALEGYVGETARREADAREDLAKFVAFLSGFADTCHHGKEEGILFAEMVAHGFPEHGGPIAVMLHEHGQGRTLIAEMRRLAEQQAPWSGEDRALLGEAAHGYAMLLRNHIHKEDAILYPMARQHLPPEAMAEVGEACERFEAERAGAGGHERYHALAEELAERYAAERRDAPSPLPVHRRS